MKTLKYTLLVTLLIQMISCSTYSELRNSSSPEPTDDYFDTEWGMTSAEWLDTIVEQNIEPTDAEKEEKLRVFIQAKAAGSDPDAVLLSKHIDDVKVVVEDKMIIYMVYREIDDEKELYRLFELLFFAGLAHSANDRNELIWDTDSIGVVFIDEEYDYIDIYMDREGFQEFFTNPENPYSIVHLRTSND